MTAPSFIGVHLIVNDFAASVAFYRHLALDWPEDSDAEHVEIDLGGGTHLAISGASIAGMYDPGCRLPAGQSGAALQFQMADRDAVDQIYTALTHAGYHGHLPPTDAFWGSRYAEVDDPDGNIVGFHSQREFRR